MNHERKPLNTGSASQAATNAGAYGGAEIGSRLGGAVGPPIIGGIVGNVVGEKLGGMVTKTTGLDRVASQAHEDISKVVGKNRADKVGEIAMTALGYSPSEYCLCCPCLPASQVMFFLMSMFFVFNCYRLTLGVQFESKCSVDTFEYSQVLHLPWTEFSSSTNTSDSIDFISVLRNDTDTIWLLVSYPCEFGFHYLVAGAAVWIVFLPFHLFTLLGNCWRQCCCCFCDPLTCLATILDLFKKCCCECGRFSLLDFIWYSMCLFQVIWSCLGLKYLIETLTDPLEDYKNFDTEEILIPTMISSITLDFVFAGSELFHKIRLFYVEKNQNKKAEELELNSVP